jgi:ParB-like chromosome segregation protein Spo0J
MPKPSPSGLAIEYLPIGQLRVNQRNPRHHSDRQIKQLAHSIEAFGFNVPVLIDQLDNVIAGHGRLLACALTAVDHVPVIRLAHLTATQAKAFSLADNRLTEISTWNDHLLAEVLGELAVLDLDFSIEATGFSTGEIDLRIESLSAEQEQATDPADELPQPPDHPAVSAAGDLWTLGRHRVLCGDALDATAYEKLMDARTAQVVFADPPYNVPIHGHVSGNGAIRHREFAMASGEMTAGQFTHFLASFMCQAARHSENGSVHFICTDWRHLLELLTAGSEVYSKLLNVCAWVKPNGGMGSLYRSRHELVLVYRHGTAQHRNNVELGQHGRNRTNVWTYASPSSFGREGEEGRLSALHPTVKPVALIADAILDCSARGDVVLDPFLGSGTTLIAAERTGRSCYGIEIDPLYVDTIVRRWQRHSGDAAVHTASGCSFNEIAAEREARHV